MTQAADRARERLLAAWLRANPNQPMNEGMDEVRRALDAIEAERPMEAGWWHTETCWTHDDDRNCIDRDGFIVGWPERIGGSTFDAATDWRSAYFALADLCKRETAVLRSQASLFRAAVVGGISNTAERHRLLGEFDRIEADTEAAARTWAAADGRAPAIAPEDWDQIVDLSDVKRVGS